MLQALDSGVNNRWPCGNSIKHATNTIAVLLEEKNTIKRRERKKTFDCHWAKGQHAAK